MTLLGVLDIEKWGEWESKCSSKDVAKRMKMRETTVRRAFKDLIELNLISRVAQRRETVEGNAYHHRAVTRLNVKEVMSDTPLAHNEPPLAHSELTPLAHNEPPLAHSELTPLAHSELTPTLIVSYNTTGVTTEDNNRETTEDNNRETQSSHSSEPDQQSKAEEVEVLVDEGKYPQHVIDYARGTGHTLERAQEIMINKQRKLEIRRAREKSGANHNRPTTAYNPCPLDLRAHRATEHHKCPTIYAADP
jgi:hypothetical protein